MNTQDASDKLASLGLNYTPDKIAGLARENIFPNAKKDKGGKWEIPDSDITDFANRQTKRRRLAIIATCIGTIGVIATMCTIISGVKDFHDLIGDISSKSAITSPTSTQVSTGTAVNTTQTPQILLSSSLPDESPNLTIERGYSAIAICSSQLVELEEIRIDSLETYGYEDISSYINTTQSSNCLCLQQRGKLFTVPSVCNNVNTYIVEPNSDWRETPIFVIFQDIQFRCEAQPFASTYTCDLKNE